MVENAPAPAELNNRRTLRDRIAPITQAIQRGLNRGISNTFVNNELGTPLTERSFVERVGDPPEDLSRAPLRDTARYQLARLARFGRGLATNMLNGAANVIERPTTPTPPVVDDRPHTGAFSGSEVIAPPEAGNNFAQGLRDLAERVRPGQAPEVPQRTLPSLRNETRYALGRARDVIRERVGNVTGANDQREELHGWQRNPPTVRLRSQAGLVLSNIIFGEGRVTPTDQYRIDEDTGLVIDARRRIRGTLGELEERTEGLEQSPDLADQRQARIYEQLIDRLRTESHASRGNWGPMKESQDGQITLSFSGIMNGSDPDSSLPLNNLTGEMDDPNTYFQERRALELLGLRDPSQVTEHLRENETYAEAVQRLARDRFTITMADRYNLRFPNESGLQLVTRLSLEATKRGQNIGELIESEHVAFLNGMGKEQLLVILHKTLNPENLGRGDLAITLDEIEKLPPVAMSNAAKVLLAEIAAGNINSRKVGSLRVEASTADLERLAGMVKQENVSAPNPYLSQITTKVLGSFVEIFPSGGAGQDLFEAIQGVDLSSVDQVTAFIKSHIDDLSQDQKYNLAVLLPANINIAVKMKLAQDGIRLS